MTAQFRQVSLRLPGSETARPVMDEAWLLEMLCSPLKTLRERFRAEAFGRDYVQFLARGMNQEIGERALNVIANLRNALPDADALMAQAPGQSVRALVSPVDLDDAQSRLRHLVDMLDVMEATLRNGSGPSAAAAVAARTPQRPLLDDRAVQERLAKFEL